MKIRNTFSNRTDDADENDPENDIQKRIVMAQSMLQVTFRSKKYKNWLFDTINWLKDFNVAEVDSSQLSVFLDKWMCDYYNNLSRSIPKKEESNWVFEALGTNTPHFVFNFIDYLYWVARKHNYKNIRYIDEVRDFNFHYYNSIEHHLPQSYENTDNVNIDNIGNLCLISRRANSGLNDKAPKEKAKLDDKLQPKRRIMYRITQDANGLWGKRQIIDHYEDIQYLLEHRSDIIEVK